MRRILRFGEGIQLWRVALWTTAVALSVVTVAVAGSRIDGTVEVADGKPDRVVTNSGSDANLLSEDVAETVLSRMGDSVAASQPVDDRSNTAVANNEGDGVDALIGTDTPAPQSATAIVAGALPAAASASGPTTGSNGVARIAGHQTIVIDFDTDPSGNDIPNGALIGEQYAALGVHFSPARFFACRRLTCYPTYTVRPSLNYLCTFSAVQDVPGTQCLMPIGGLDARLVVVLDFPVSFASIEGYTRNDGVFDSDGVTIQAFDGAGNLLATGVDTCNNDPPPHTTEGVCVAEVSAIGIRRLEVLQRPDFIDALDTLTLRVDDPPVANPQTVSACAQPSTPITLTGSDPEGRPLTFTIVNPPTSGSLSGTPPNVVYTPNATFVISDSFTFKVNDGASDSNIATVTLIDDTPPSLTVTGPSGWINVDGLVTATTSDICDVSPTVTFFNPSPASVQSTGNTHVARYVDEGFYLDVMARAVDDSANATEAPAPDFAIDRTPPGHNYAGIPPELSTVDDLPLAFDAMDLPSPAVSGLSSVQVTLDGSITLLSKTYPSLGLLVPGPLQDAVACDHPTLCFAGALDLGQLALGEHDIRIVVTDMAGNVSESNFHFNLRPLIVLDFKFNPRVLNLKSQGQWVSVEFCVPDGLPVTAADVDPATVFLVDPFGNQYALDPSGPFDVRGNCFHFKVDRQRLVEGLLAGLGWTPGGDGNETDLTMTVIGQFFSTGGNSGGSFAGEGVVHVINPGGGGGRP